MKKRNMVVGALVCGMLLSSISEPVIVGAEMLQGVARDEDQIKNSVYMRFYFYDNDERIGSQSIFGNEGDTYELSKIKLPNGYKLDTDNPKDVKLTDNESEPFKIKVVKVKRIVTLRYVDVTNGAEKAVADVKLSVPILDRSISEKNIMERLPKGFILTEESDKPINIRDTNEKTYTIKVKRVENDLYTNTIQFRDYDTQKSVGKPFLISGKLNRPKILDISNLPTGYFFQYSNLGNYSSVITITSSEKTRYVDVRRDQEDSRVRNFVHFIDKSGKLLETKILTENEGKTVDLGKLFPVYDFGDDYQYKISKDGTEATIKNVKREYVEQKIKFVDEHGHLSGRTSLIMKIGHTFEAQQGLAPAGYKIKNTSDTFTAQSSPSEVVIVVIPNTVFNMFKIVDYDNEEDVLMNEVLIKGLFGHTPVFPPDLIPGYKLSSRNYTQMNYSSKIETISFMKVVKNTIRFIDNGSGKVIDEKVVKGVRDESYSVEIPLGYKLNSGEKKIEGTINDPRWGTKTIFVYKKNNSDGINSGTHVGNNSNSHVTKPDVSQSQNETDGKPSPNSQIDKTANGEAPNINEVFSNEQKYLGVISTHSGSRLIPLFSMKGKQSNRSLSANTDWKIDRKATINGETFYRVSTNEWVKAAHVFEYSVINQNITTKAGKTAELYNSKFKLSNRSLAGDTSWHTDKSRVVDGKTYYRVSTDEWVAATDINK
ncbi:SLAP domain-containing protein [Companilactobacillus ginsenosidimutans]|uniref:S-layer protein C-terminal domain-containing protein n=1 Tax=Companilactobacillus ginsenosidimutans TaxID=1007676 RepID=A0A0H4QIT1_9LACO|nr:SLAP domain-containing protein [Companilactobacillus ginsenosidimutans]AKP67852.1 hypothetical protein ABM34_10130 [Companilactobacillus ginsenosidimutans]